MLGKSFYISCVWNKKKKSLVSIGISGFWITKYQYQCIGISISIKNPVSAGLYWNYPKTGAASTWNFRPFVPGKVKVKDHLWGLVWLVYNIYFGHICQIKTVKISHRWLPACGKERGWKPPSVNNASPFSERERKRRLAHERFWFSFLWKQLVSHLNTESEPSDSHAH